MGRRNFRGKDRRGGGGGGRGGAASGGWREYPEIVKENKNLQNFYDTLLQLPEEEKKEYWEVLRRELPNSFRFCGSKGHAIAVKRLLQTRYIPDIVKIEHYDGRTVESPMAVPWYPDDLAWWMTTPKTVIRKFPPFAAFQKFLVSETSVGNISRQEVVSMIPPLLIDLRPGMTALDLCAAPGSKAAQLVEMVHQGEEARVRKVLRAFGQEDGMEQAQEEEEDADLEADPSDAGRATGLLIANDADYKRCHMLVHQLKRLSSPNLIVSNHDATMFPSIRLPQKDPKSNQNVYLKFDRILADVPCSGDGTIRKNVGLWKDWQPGNALGLHVTQIRILVRALQLLKVGGRVVYSTCSMNPIENEAVVAAAIERCGGPESVEIVDCSEKLPLLKRYPGLKSWKMMDKAARIWSSWEEVETFVRDENEGVTPARLVPTMFPKPAGSESPDLPLERCMRIYPHMQDTGAFFITVLEKTSEFKAKNEREPKEATKANGAEGKLKLTDVDDVLTTEQPATTNGSMTLEEDDQPAESAKAENGDMDISTLGKRALEEEDDQPAKRVKVESETTATATQSSDAPAKRKRGDRPEEPFKFLDPTHPIIQNIKEFYHLSPRFPDDRYMVRNEMGEPAKAIYYVTALMRDILTENEGRGIKFIHGGVRMYMKQEVPSPEVCRWRIQAEGMPILQGYVGEPRVVHLHSKETFRRLLIEMFPRVADEDWRNFGEIGERVRDITMGCCVLRVEPAPGDPDFSEGMALPLWKSVHSLNLMLPKEDRAAMLLRLFNDTSPLINTNLQKERERVKAEAATKAANGAAGEADGDLEVEDVGASEEATGEDPAAMLTDEGEKEEP